MKLEIPIRTSSPNAKLGKHWSKLRRIVDSERKAVAYLMRSCSEARDWFGHLYMHDPEDARDPCTCEMPIAVVKLTRISPRPLDDDNLRGALKAVRDQVAEELGVDDRDPRVRWEYAQEKGKPKQYAVRIEVRNG